jgi:hypothetical protein
MENCFFDCQKNKEIINGKNIIFSVFVWCIYTTNLEPILPKILENWKIAGNFLKNLFVPGQTILFHSNIRYNKNKHE